MPSDTSGENSPAIPYALFMGDFNVGKSTLLNALLRHEVLFTSRQESKALTTFVQRSGGKSPAYVARVRATGEVARKSHEEFLSLRTSLPGVNGYCSMGAQVPASPFQHLVLVDTPGTSSDTCETTEIADLPSQEDALLVVVTDIEYWASKHNMDFIDRHLEAFGENLVVVANKADHLNAREIERIAHKAATRMESYGIDKVPPFYPLSARLEASRRDPRDEYRQRTKPAVRTQCDAGFDALRVRLYEFESARCGAQFDAGNHAFLQSALAKAYVEKLKGDIDAVS